MMKGFAFKKATVILVLVSTGLFSSLVSSTPDNTERHQDKQVHAKAGCMMCHQGEASQSRHTQEKNTNKLQAKRIG